MHRRIYINSNPSYGSLRSPPPQYSSLLCSSLLLILMECYFIPSSSEMTSLLGMTARWWRSKMEELKKIPPTVAEIWRTKNEARLRAIDKVREQFNGKGEDWRRVQVYKRRHIQPISSIDYRPQMPHPPWSPFSVPLTSLRRWTGRFSVPVLAGARGR